MTTIHRFLTSLAFTTFVEACVLLYLLRHVIKNRIIETWRILFAGVFASFATIPYVWFVFPSLVKEFLVGSPLLYSEPFAFIVEAIFYRAFLKLNWKSAFALSFICNAASYLLGPLLRACGLWIYW